jgi:hypothetical protein
VLRAKLAARDSEVADLTRQLSQLAAEGGGGRSGSEEQ